MTNRFARKTLLKRSEIISNAIKWRFANMLVQARLPSVDVIVSHIDGAVSLRMTAGHD